MGNETSKSSGTASASNPLRRNSQSEAAVGFGGAPAATEKAGSPNAASTAASVPSRPIALSAETPPLRSASGATDTVGSSVPRYVDAKSMVYTLPCFTPDRSLSSPTSGGAGPRSQPIAIQMAASQQLPMMSSSSDFRVGAPSSPLSPSRRHFSAANLSNTMEIPTYNTSTPTAVEDLSCSSPVLKSYRQHSFSHSKRDACLADSPNSPDMSVHGGASLSAGASEAPVAMSLATSFSPGAGSGSPSTAIHTKFLEITGHPLGLENYGNTCYCNSVIQLIYHCAPLRLRLLELYHVYLTKKGKSGFEEDTVLFQLCSLIAVMHKSNNRTKDKYPREKIAPKELLNCVRAKNEVFNNDMQQDAHEFTMFLLNDIWDTEQRIMADPANVNLFLKHETSMKKKGSLSFSWKHSKDKHISSHSHKENKLDKTTSAAATNSDAGANGGKAVDAQQPFSGELTPLQVILQGQFGSLTACLECENVTAREEVFMDLSLETAQGTSLLRCLDHFGDPEYFWGKNKLRCEECKMPVRAAKTIHVQQLPQYALLIHLKRFQYDVKKQIFTKKADHVALPMQMDVEEYLTDPEVVEQSLRNKLARSQKNIGVDAVSSTSGHNNSGSGQKDEANATSSTDTFKPASEEVRRKLRGVARHKARFELTGFVAHIGEGPNSGHYFTCVRYGPQLWRRFDDETVSTMAERDVKQYFGVPSDAVGVVTTTAYILLYERVA
ncbi:ubiquitin hydrolase, putative [Leishmania donovani]|uniref:Ubiquitin carboxyl-terminal hydrolase n=1 Tax=Leishmania donovani TaxID=5661 RepID=A0A3Q8IB18_LEIDO|nr:ubiquitin hydrolase, putative [Leishmania donovani]AYU78507.1 Peptidase C19, ubiquitin carboxyl-terminal hydrolase, putative [Leishmania donovani]TPP49279.1 Ubiquitin carboxyl-terminal hydrolase family protein [Leishmania donovani]CBZ33857.1 ubiquitin hydrolase, putative [Leishmania donovani]